MFNDAINAFSYIEFILKNNDKNISLKLIKIKRSQQPT